MTRRVVWDLCVIAVFVWWPYSHHWRPVHAVSFAVTWLLVWLVSRHHAMAHMARVRREHRERAKRVRAIRVPTVPTVPLRVPLRCLHPMHKVGATLVEGVSVEPGDEWKGVAPEPARLTVDIQCTVCGVNTGHLFALGEIPLDDRLGTDRLVRLYNPGRRQLHVVMPDGTYHILLPIGETDSESQSLTLRVTPHER